MLRPMKRTFKQFCAEKLQQAKDAAKFAIENNAVVRFAYTQTIREEMRIDFYNNGEGTKITVTLQPRKYVDDFIGLELVPVQTGKNGKGGNPKQFQKKPQQKRKMHR